MHASDWQPSATLHTLKQRAVLLASIRRFFAERDVWEVDTPLLSACTATDPYLASFAVPVIDDTRYLQTSPEFMMKRLLAAGSGAIYQLGKAFRYEEQGRLHNPEFTLLEWYRPGWTLTQLIDETVDLITAAARDLGITPPTVGHAEYRDLFLTHCNLDPHQASVSALRDRVNSLLGNPPPALSRDDCLQLLMSEHVERHMPEGLLVVREFPASQAALAAIGLNRQQQPVALRSELYWNGVELANGYQELTDGSEQRQRFEQDLAQRGALSLPTLPLPETLLAALSAGIPQCAGIALGIDRLLMCLLALPTLADALPFDFERA